MIRPAAFGEALMHNPGTLSAALAYLPGWWQETTEPALFDSLLAGWVRAAGWRAAGFVWPVDTAPTVVKVAPAGAASDSAVPAEVAEVVRQLRQGDETVVVTTATGGSR